MELDGVVGGEVDREEQRGGMPVEDLDEAAVEVGVSEADVGVEGLGVGAPVEEMAQAVDCQGKVWRSRSWVVSATVTVIPRWLHECGPEFLRSFYVGSGDKRARNSV
ncbi:hypothetical protein [Cellulosimicrobium composti]|uniref:hypothetical protein n=1 Tax=Cellulosimicrobium composti TaxID=2672572 RepID=UPI00378CFC41